MIKLADLRLQNAVGAIRLSGEGNTVERFLTSGTLARATGLSRERIRQLEAAGQLPTAIRDSMGRRLFREADVQKFLEERKKAALGQPVPA